MPPAFPLLLGVKTDPIEYRFSFPWLFDLLAEEGVEFLQLGSFFEEYQLPDAWFLRLREEAEQRGLRFTSTFTAHRELGGFLADDPAWVAVARRSYERHIEVGALLGATSVGSNPGAILRDQMPTKPAAMRTYIDHMKDLMHVAHAQGVQWLTIEPMSCLAEPPTLPAEMAAMCRELDEHHAAHPRSTARVGLCVDIAHGYADESGAIVHDHHALLDASLPWLLEVHLKNTDAQYNSTFGFTPTELAKGIIDVAATKAFLLERAARLPVDRLVGYLEIGGPKLGRDYSDKNLGALLRGSLAHLKETWEQAAEAGFPAPASLPARASLAVSVPKASEAPGRVLIAPSMMCASQARLEGDLRLLERAGVDALHFDIMDGHFVPNMPLGLEVIKALRPLTPLPFDVHLMVEDNAFYIDLLRPLGVQMITFHAESTTHLDRMIDHARTAAPIVGVAINPATPLSALEYVWDKIDVLLLMTVNPGYAGQKLTPQSIRKIGEARAEIARRGVDVAIQVDGNVSFEHIPAMVAAGADNLVAGTSSVFHRDGSILSNTLKSRALVADGLARRKGA